MGEKGSNADREAALTDLVNQEIIAEGRDALQQQDRDRRRGGGGGGGSTRGGSTNDLDNTP